MGRSGRRRRPAVVQQLKPDSCESSAERVQHSPPDAGRRTHEKDTATGSQPLTQSQTSAAAASGSRSSKQLQQQQLGKDATPRAVLAGRDTNNQSLTLQCNERQQTDALVRRDQLQPHTLCPEPCVESPPKDLAANMAELHAQLDAAASRVQARESFMMELHGMVPVLKEMKDLMGRHLSELHQELQQQQQLLAEASGEITPQPIVDRAADRLHQLKQQFTDFSIQVQVANDKVKALQQQIQL